MKENLGNRICLGKTSLQAENLGIYFAKHCWDTAHFQPTRASLPLGSLVGPRSSAGLVLMQHTLAGQRRLQGLAESDKSGNGFSKAQEL